MERMMAYLLAEGILLRLDDSVVSVEGLLENLGLNTHLLCKSLTRVETLHQATTDVVLAVPFNLVGSLAVED